MQKIFLILLALGVGGVFATSTYETAEARVVVKKKKRVSNRAEWIRTAAVTPTRNWWTGELHYYGTPYWSLAKHGGRGVWVSSRRRR